MVAVNEGPSSNGGLCGVGGGGGGRRRGGERGDEKEVRDPLALQNMAPRGSD